MSSVQASVTICTIRPTSSSAATAAPVRFSTLSLRDSARMACSVSWWSVTFVALDENSGGAAVIGRDGLVDEIEIALVERAVRRLLQIDEHAAPDIGLAGSVDAIE